MTFSFTITEQVVSLHLKPFDPSPPGPRPRQQAGGSVYSCPLSEAPIKRSVAPSTVGLSTAGSGSWNWPLATNLNSLPGTITATLTGIGPGGAAKRRPLISVLP